MKYCKISFLASLFFYSATAFSQNLVTNKLDSFSAVKAKFVKASGCANDSQFACQAMISSENFDTLLSAQASKRINDEKKLKDRISVLECCLDVDTTNTCAGLNPESRRDLESCQKKIKK